MLAFIHTIINNKFSNISTVQDALTSLFAIGLHIIASNNFQNWALDAYY